MIVSPHPVKTLPLLSLPHQLNSESQENMQMLYRSALLVVFVNHSHPGFLMLHIDLQVWKGPRTWMDFINLAITALRAFFFFF